MNRFIASIMLTVMLVLVVVAPVAAADPFTQTDYTVSIPIMMSTGTVAAASSATKTVDVIAFPGPDGIAPGPGATATLKRYSDKVKVKITTNSLDAGAAYTVWAVVWNDPTQCDGGCGEDDLGKDGNSVFWATGKVINANGTAQFNALIHEGTPKGQVLIPGGLTDAENAEIHFIIRAHGQPIPGQVPAQTKTYLGGCNVNTCEDQQGVVFNPMMP